MLTAEDFSTLVDLIHQAAVTPGSWHRALTAVMQATRSSVAGLLVRSPDRFAELAVTFGASEETIASYNTYYRQIDPVLPAVMSLPPGSVATQQMAVQRSELVRSEFYNDWLHPQGIDDLLAVTIPAQRASGVLAFACPRQMGGFDGHAVRLLQLLVPHVRTSVQTFMQLHGLDLQRRDVLAELDRIRRAVFLVREPSRIDPMNNLAEAVLRAGDGLSRGQSGLQVSHRQQAAALSGLIAAACRRTGGHVGGGSLAVRRPSGKEPYILRVVPIIPGSPILSLLHDARALVFVSVPEQGCGADHLTLRQMFGLTQAEARVADLITRGSNVKTAAAELAVAPSTIRTHLLQVFAKTGTSRQADRVRLISQIG